MSEPIRLQKFLATRGVGSRRQVETWIREGRLSINGRQAKLGDRVKNSDRIMLDKKPLNAAAPTSTQVLMYHKPVGEICTRDDPEGRPTIFESLPPLKVGRWITIGRLDINSSGLLLLTNNGDLAQHLMHPKYEVEREYAVRVRGELTEPLIKNLLDGVILEEGRAAFKTIQPAGGRGQNYWYHVTLMQGLYHEVRRLFASQDLAVNRLIRIRYGSVRLPRDLKAKNSLLCPETQVKKLLEHCGHD